MRPETPNSGSKWEIPPLSSLCKLLKDAAAKLLKLRQDPEWKKELLLRCPPILWFGDIYAKKTEVVTLGANPSRREYIADTPKQALEKMQRTGDESQIRYLEPPKQNRFRVLRGTETINDILTNDALQTEIISGYNSYFKTRPFKEWFGRDKSDSYAVEGFLRGFGASYYGLAEYQAIHIDLFPFATVRNFTKLRDLTNRDLFKNGWAKSLIEQLLSILSPHIVLVFGKTNVNLYGQYIDLSFKRAVPYKYEKGEYCISKMPNKTVIGLSTNLGNPIGFSANDLNSYGKQVRKNI
jgi:hypothetical protein